MDTQAAQSQALLKDRRGLPNDAALTVDQVCEVLQVSKAWLYSPAGKSAVGSGFKLGGSRRYRASVIAAVLSR